jgi:predicted nucleotidyltransferase
MNESAHKVYDQFMDLSRPIEALIPGARGRLLGALIGAGCELSTADAARLSGVSAPQASRVLGQLVELGIIERRDVPPAVVYRPVPGNAVVGMLLELCELRNRIIRFARESAAAITPCPVRLSVFGSVARGTSDGDSDIDIAAVRPARAEEDDDWVESLEAWRRGVQEFSGSTVNVIEIDVDEWLAFDLSERTFWRDVKRDEVVLFEREAARR